MQNKTLLAKIVGLVAVVCLALAMTFGLVACGDATVKNITQDGNVITVELTDGKTSEIKLDGVKDAKVENGKLVLTYADGKTAEFALGNATIAAPAVNNDGNTEIVVTFADGTTSTIVLNKVVADATFDGDKFVVTYTDGTTAEYAISSVTNVEALANGQTKITYADGTTATIGDAACDHEFGDSTVIKPASCCDEGVAVKACKECGFVALESVAKNPEAHGHWSIEPKVEEGDPVVYIQDGMIVYERYDTGSFEYYLVTDYDYENMTILEGYSRAIDRDADVVKMSCFKAMCKDCGAEFATGHAPVDEWVNIVLDDASVNVCENEHTVYKTCPQCKSVLLYDDGVIVKNTEPALGHVYGAPVIGEKVTNVDKPYYPVTLTCTRAGCGKVQEVKAYLEDEFEEKVLPNCSNDGYYKYYATYKYEYSNIVDGVNTTLYGTFNCENKNLVYESTGEHVIAEGLPTYMYYDPDDSDVAYQYNSALKPFFADETITWNNDTPGSCSEYKLAVFECAVCGKTIVIRLSGEHDYPEGDGTPVGSTCVYDGYTYKVCANNADHVWKYDIQSATGHDFKYQEGSFNADAMTATFKCACGATLNNIEVEIISENPAETCKNVSSTTYGTTYAYEITHINEHGVDMEPVEVEAELEFTIKATDEVKRHTLAKVPGLGQFIAYDDPAAEADDYEVPEEQGYLYNGLIGAQFEAGTITWNNEIAGTCTTYRLAVFKCVECQKTIVIHLSNEHVNLDLENVEDGNEVVEATCTTRGYVKVQCLDCNQLILQSAEDAKGHTFVADADSWNAFVAEPADGAEVTFTCTSCPATTVEPETITLYAKKTAGTPVANGCETVTTDVYDFFDEDGEVYTYYIQSALGEAEEEYSIEKPYQPKSYKVVTSVGAHLLGTFVDEEGEHEIRYAAYNEDAPKDEDQIPAHKDFFANGTLTWNNDIAGNCRTWKFAVFTCADCGKTIVIHLSGEHVFGTAANQTRVTQPGCLEGGKTEKYCTVCNNWVTVATTNALGHNYGAWTVVGDRFAAAYEENGQVYLGDYALGYARSVCTRCQDELVAEGAIGQQVLPTCGEKGKLYVDYYKDGLLVATAEIDIDIIDHHITTYETAKHVIKWYDDGLYYLGYVCEECGELVVQYKSVDEEVINNKVEILVAVFKGRFEDRTGIDNH